MDKKKYEKLMNESEMKLSKNVQNSWENELNTEASNIAAILNTDNRVIK